MARIRVNGKSLYLGTFDTEEDAAKVYDQAAVELWGEFALQNFTGETEVNLNNQPR